MKFTADRHHEWMMEPDEADVVGEAHPAPLPVIWDWLRDMFARLVKKVGSPGQIVRRGHLSRIEIAEINWWLRPLESLAGALVLVEAGLWLLMTPEGRKLWLRGPTTGMPQPKEAKPAPRMIPHPGWHTIAQPLREQVEAQADETSADDGTHAMIPSTWHCPVHGLHWVMPEEEDDEDTGPGPSRGPMVMLIGDYDPLQHALHQKQRAEAEKRRLARLGANRSAAYRIAFRMESLSRLLADPTAHILRYARFLARIPREGIDPSGIYSPRHTRRWRHGHFARRALFTIIRRVFERLKKPLDPEMLVEPG